MFESKYNLRLKSFISTTHISVWYPTFFVGSHSILDDIASKLTFTWNKQTNIKETMFDTILPKLFLNNYIMF